MSEANHSQHERYIFGYDVTVPSLEEIEDKLYALKGIVAVILLSPIAGFMTAASLPLSGSFLIDGVIFTALPWVFWLLVFRIVRLVRARRFGPEHARTALTRMDLIFAVGATLIGPYLAITFIPRALGSRDYVNILLALGGVIACVVPIRTIAIAVSRR